MPIDRVRLNPGHGDLKVLDSPPKDFRKPFNPSLTRSDAPRMEAHIIKAGEIRGGGLREGQDKSGAHVSRGQRDSKVQPGPGKGGTGNFNTLPSGLDQKGPRGKGASVPIVSDHSSQGFMT